MISSPFNVNNIEISRNFIQAIWSQFDGSVSTRKKCSHEDECNRMYSEIKEQVEILKALQKEDEKSQSFIFTQDKSINLQKSHGAQET